MGKEVIDNPLSERQGVVRASESSGLGSRLSWKLYSLAVIGLLTFFQICQWQLLPRFLDIYYHLCVTRGFVQAGGYTPHAFWEYAPVGRPQLYPPFLHLILYWPYKAGIPFIELARATDCVSFPILILSGWLMIRKIFSDSIAFFWLVIFCSAYSTYLSAATLPAFNLGFVVAFISLLAAYRYKTGWASILAGLTFYCHLLTGAFLATLLLALALLDNKRRKDFFRIFLFGILFASPFLIYTACWIKWFRLLPLRENYFYDLDPWVFVLAVTGLWSLRRHGIDRPFVIAGLISVLTWAALYPVRFLNGQGLFIIALLAALAIERLYRYICSGRSLAVAACFAGTFFVLFSLALPILDIDFKTNQSRWRWFDRTIGRLCIPADYMQFKARGFSIFFPKDYDQIVELIKENSDEDDIFWSDFSHGAGILSLLSSRATSCAMLPEIRPAGVFDPLQSARILVWFKDKRGKAPPTMAKVAEAYQLHLLAQTDIAYVYLNPRASAKVIFPKTVINWSCMIAGFFVFRLILSHLFVTHKMK